MVGGNPADKGLTLVGRTPMLKMDGVITSCNSTAHSSCRIQLNRQLYGGVHADDNDKTIDIETEPY